MDYLPVFLNVKEKRALVVGGGRTALRKARLLRRAGADVRVVAPRVDDDLARLLDSGRHEVRRRDFREQDLDGTALVVAATDDESLNRRLHDAAVARGIPVNVVDHPDLCTFIFPSTVDRSPVIVAISSGGRSPVLARLLKARLETFIPSGYGALADLLGKYRGSVKKKIATIGQRMRFWESVMDGPVAEQAMAGKTRKAEALLKEAIDHIDAGDYRQGEVYLVGAGPGDPDLLTFRALRLMQRADVVLYDRLVAPEILDMCRQDAEKIHVGKQRKKHTLPQQEISAMLVDLARQGKRVLRLKGGDPFIFGRGGEEIAELSAAGLPFQVVPGITAASGCACYAGIPLTHRDYAQSVRFLTGHLKDDGCELDWEHLVQTNETLVFYMGLVSLPVICRELINHGRSPETPAALIQQGTTRNQKVLTGTLETLPGIVADAEVKAPTLTIVGEVVRLHDSLAWKSV